MRTGENDKLDAKHNAGVGPGIRQLGQRGESRANFSLFLPLLVSRHFLLSPIFFPPFLSFFHFRTNVALPFTQFYGAIREREVFEECEFSYGTTVCIVSKRLVVA